MSRKTRAIAGSKRPASGAMARCQTAMVVGMSAVVSIRETRNQLWDGFQAGVFQWAVLLEGGAGGVVAGVLEKQREASVRGLLNPHDFLTIQ